MKYNSADAEENWPNGQKPDYLCTLHELFPKEIAFFKQRFVWPSSRSGVYVRHRYEAISVPLCYDIPKWCPLKTRGRWQHLYPALVNSLVEKHLNFRKFYKLKPPRDRLTPNSDETAFWFGTMAGLQTYSDCIDLDSHELIGWISKPTLWHSTVTGEPDGPYSWRDVPVVKPSLRFFQVAKVVYDHFPNRIWAFSSANFGLAIWKVYDQPKMTEYRYASIESRLLELGLTIEHYPMPAKSGLGRCHRRPCGMDSAIITDDGLIVDSVEQVRAFMKPPKTPTFSSILRSCLEALRQSYETFLSEGEGVDHKRIPKHQKEVMVDGCRAVLSTVEEWAAEGCPINRDLTLEQKPLIDDGFENESVYSRTDIATAEHKFDPASASMEISEQYPDFFHWVDLAQVAKFRQWVPFVKFLVENGIPTEDRFSQVISTLALWFGFVELFGEDRDRIKTVLTKFALTRHNGNVSRLIAGQEHEVVAHVGRIVDSVLNGENPNGKQIFAEIRQKRSNGQYKQRYFFEPQIMNEEQDSSLLFTGDIQQSYLLCGGLILDSGDEKTDSEWIYEPDDTPLPAEVLNDIFSAFKAAKRQIRINRTTGRYSTIDAITRFFNYLFCGRKSGTRRASQTLLVQMGFQKKNLERDQVMEVLEDFGMIRRGGYLSGQKSRQWFLDTSVVESMLNARSQQRQVS